MDLNQLLYHHQIALIHASQQNVPHGGSSQFDLVRHYAKRIRVYRSEHGLSQYPSDKPDASHRNSGETHIPHAAYLAVRVCSLESIISR